MYFSYKAKTLWIPLHGMSCEPGGGRHNLLVPKTPNIPNTNLLTKWSFAHEMLWYIVHNTEIWPCCPNHIVGFCFFMKSFLIPNTKHLPRVFSRSWKLARNIFRSRHQDIYHGICLIYTAKCSNSDYKLLIHHGLKLVLCI